MNKRGPSGLPPGGAASFGTGAPKVSPGRMNVIRGAGAHPVAFLGRHPVFLKGFIMKLYAVIGTITPDRGEFIHLYGLHTDRKAAERRRAEVEAAARRANEGEIEDVAPRLVKVVEADGDAAVDIFLGGYIE